MTTHASPFLRIALLALSATVVSCQTTRTTSDGAPMAAKPIEVAPPPVTMLPNAIAITFAPKPVDTDGNDRPDTLQVTVFLFARPHPAPHWCDGEFHFAIFPPGKAGTPTHPGVAPIREWSLSAELVAAARTRALVGPCYEFNLSLLEGGGSDAMEHQSVDLVAWFQPTAGGPRVWLRGIRAVQYPQL
ncbi:MAG: hypothetical protein EXS10_05605 [Phycisphaerales bacterium]|nr:hypothetical protein [Phycisphaerales bacterium]